MKNWIQAARVYIVGASVLPAVLGALQAFYEKGGFDLTLFVCTLVGVALIHFAANLLNDYYDYRSGVDLNNPEGVFPFSGGSRVIVEGKIKPEAVFRGAAVCLVIASIIGIYLTWRVGILVLIWGVFGILTSIYYVHPRFNLTNMGFGELAVGLNFGVLTVSGAYYVQTGAITLSCIMASIPIALIIALILFVNEFPDFSGDKLAAKMTAVVRLGRRRASYLLVMLLIITELSVLFNAVYGFTNLWSLTGLLTLPFIVHAAVYSLKYYDNIPRMIPANISIIKSHLFMNMYLAISCLQTGGLTGVSYILLGLVFLQQLFTMSKMRFTAV